MSYGEQRLMSIGGEKAAVQEPLVRYATEAGWTDLWPDEALRLRGERRWRRCSNSCSTTS